MNVNTNRQGNFRRPTLEDVARVAGVSRAMASIVVRGAPGASQESKEKVLAAIEEVGYRPDTRARSLAAARNRLIGVQFTLESYFHTRLVGRLYEAAAELDYQLLLSGTTQQRSAAEALTTLVSARPEGIVLIDPGSLDPALLSGTPAVAIGHTGPETLDHVITSGREGIRLALNHLGGLGHRDICHVTITDHAAALQRLDAYDEWMTERNLRTDVLRVAGSSVKDGTKAARALLSRDRLPGAVIAYNDEMASGCLLELTRRGVSVPDQISIIGYDNLGWAATGVRLTTVSQRMGDLAGHALAALVGRLEATTPPSLPRTIELEPILHVRETTGPVQAS